MVLIESAKVHVTRQRGVNMYERNVGLAGEDEGIEWTCQPHHACQNGLADLDTLLQDTILRF